MSDEYAIRTDALRKTYRSVRGRHVAVDSLDLRVRTGGVHGFLGPNGSGKTTTIRMLLGLVRPDSGSMQLFGQTVPDRLPDVIGRVGAIVESPKLFPAFSGRLNLTLLADGIGAERSRVDHVLEETGLRERADDTYSSYSLGMKQRLAIAATLLKDPDLLIFDEPTNGLDPAGIHEIRGTMRRLADGGRTVLVSSHILAEVEQVADTVSIIGRGRLLATGTVAEVIGERVATVQVGVVEPARAAQVLVAAGLPARPDGDRLLVETDEPARITYLLAQHGLYVHELTTVRAGLEEVFLDLTRETTLGAGPAAAVPAAPAPPAPPAPAPAPAAPTGTATAATTEEIR